MDLKEPLSIEKQVERLKEHGLSIKNESFAKEILSRTSYYRFTGYAIQFRKNESSSEFVENISFEMVYKIYEFDKKLREIIRSYIEIAEIYYRTQIAHIFSMIKCKNPPHDQHYDDNNYCNKRGFQAILQSLSREQVHLKDSLVVKHHKQKYADKMPLWVCVELLSFSNISKLYGSMYISDKTTIAQELNTGASTLENHLHCLSVLRNKCAHAARLYNSKVSPPARFNSKYLRSHPEMKNDTLFAYLLVLHKRLPTDQDRGALKNDLMLLFSAYEKNISLDLMGVPKNWEKLMTTNQSSFKMITGTIQ